MTDYNTLLGRCTVAYEEALNTVSTNSPRRRTGIAAVLGHLAAELVMMHQRNPRLTVHELARCLTLQAAGELAGWSDDQDETWDSHPSLTAEERNPTLQ